jgi:hypothetical protein
VSQKVGKHKKRAPVSTPISKPATTVDFSWPAQAFTFENDMTMKMPLDPEMPSFELDAAEFHFTPDLNEDWQLFPELPMITPTWSTDHSYDALIFSPTAGMSQSRVSTGPGQMSLLDQGMVDQGLLSQGVLNTGVMHTGVPGTTPVTPTSLSPMSRTQSADGKSPYGYTNYNASGELQSTYSTIPQSTSFFSTDANIDQPRVSPNKPQHVPLTPASLSPLSRTQSIGDLLDLPETSALGSTTRNSFPSLLEFSSRMATPLQTTTPRSIKVDASTSNDAQNMPWANNNSQQGFCRGSIDVLRYEQQRLAYRAVLLQDDRSESMGSLRSPIAIEHKEYASILRESLQTERFRRSTSQVDPARDALAGSSRPSPSVSAISTPSTTSRSRFNLRKGLQSDSAGHLAFEGSQQPLQNELDGALGHALLNNGGSRSEHDLPEKAKNFNLDSQLQIVILKKAEVQVRGLRFKDWSLAQAPLCVALYATYCALSQSSNSFAFITTLLIAATMIALSLVDRIESCATAQTSVLSLASRAFKSAQGFIGFKGMGTPSSRREGRQGTKSRPPKWSWSSHLGLRGATVMV